MDLTIYLVCYMIAVVLVVALGLAIIACCVVCPRGWVRRVWTRIPLTTPERSPGESNLISPIPVMRDETPRSHRPSRNVGALEVRREIFRQARRSGGQRRGHARTGLRRAPPEDNLPTIYERTTVL